MSYHLLTGATGLLGMYLLRDGLRDGRRMAVVVRPSNVESARQRVETIMARWERSVGHALPRPPVLEGNISQPNLGLDDSALDWVRRNCASVMHNAASLTFQADQRSGEPRRSNVTGTQNVLELCRSAGIRRFHHVSTAYVCGLRKGRVLENELDVGQTFGNEYERTKTEAEKMVRAADFLDAPTIYRPAIIVGSSNTGYTTTFHGFYTPLEIGHAIVSRVDSSVVNGQPLMAALGFSGAERKNFVPVNWVSAAITYLSGQPRHYGKTFHLAPRRPVTVSTVCEVIEKALGEYLSTSASRHGRVADMSQLQETFRDQMEVYRAYWRDDPEFDQTNIGSAAPHLPCPEVDSEVLMRLSKFAIGVNFGWPRSQPIVPEFDVRRHLGDLLGAGPHAAETDRRLPRVGLQINGPGGGQWELLTEGERPVAADDGLDADCSALLYMNSETFRRIAGRELTARDAVDSGRVVIEGNGLPRDQLQALLEATATSGMPRGVPEA